MSTDSRQYGASDPNEEEEFDLRELRRKRVRPPESARAALRAARKAQAEEIVEVVNQTAKPGKYVAIGIACFFGLILFLIGAFVFFRDVIPRGDGQ